MNKALSPNGKATDSDSVIFKVRILVALLQKALESIESFLFTQECVTTDKSHGVREAAQVMEMQSIMTA